MCFNLKLEIKFNIGLRKMAGRSGMRAADDRSRWPAIGLTMMIVESSKL